MDETKLLQMAVRGAAELPNNPFEAFAKIELDDLRARPKRRLTKAQREQAAAQAAAFYDHLIGMYRGA
jgi:hypothetical protein